MMDVNICNKEWQALLGAVTDNLSQQHRHNIHTPWLSGSECGALDKQLGLYTHLPNTRPALTYQLLNRSYIRHLIQ